MSGSEITQRGAHQFTQGGGVAGYGASGAKKLHDHFWLLHHGRTSKVGRGLLIAVALLTLATMGYTYAIMDLAKRNVGRVGGGDDLLDHLVEVNFQPWIQAALSAGGTEPVITDEGICRVRRRLPLCRDMDLFRIKHGKMEVVTEGCEGPRDTVYKDYAQTMVRRVAETCKDLPPVEFLMNTDDWTKQEKQVVLTTLRREGVVEAPILSYQTRPGIDLDVAVPYSVDIDGDKAQTYFASLDRRKKEFLSSTSGNLLKAQVLRTEEKAEEKPDSLWTRWQDRLNVAFWRGTQTGGYYTEETWRTFSRSKFVLACFDRPDLCDAGFTGYSQVRRELAHT
jgi:hypothetical protein